MAKKILTAHFLEDHLKKGWCLDDFTKHFEVDEKEFYRLLGRVTKNSHYVDNYKKRLAANEKKSKKHNISNDTAYAEDNAESFETSSNPLKEEKTSTSESDEELQKLQEEEKALIKNIEENKKEAESLMSKEKMAKERIEELKHEIARISSSVEEICSQIDKNNSHLALDEENLKEVQAKIKELTKITIFAYSDGEMDISGDETIPEQWQSLLTELVTEDSVEGCTVKQLKQLAKIITLFESLKERELEVSWEDSNMQNIFESLK